MKRKCPFDDCNVLIDPSKFACYRHWHKLTQVEKNEIWDAYNAYLAGDIGPADLRRRQLIVLDSVRAARPPKKGGAA